MPFSELVKNFEKIRSYVREFYVYGFRIRDEFDIKSGRTYDNERRRLECILGEYTASSRDSRGKNVFLSIDSRNGGRDPLYRLLRTSSFTDRDITLHFLLMDMLDEKAPLTLAEILDRINSYTAGFSEPMIFDDSGVRKNLRNMNISGLYALKSKAGSFSISAALLTIELAFQTRWICFRRLHHAVCSAAS